MQSQSSSFHPPGSPGEQRKKEKVHLQKLNDRLEAVLGNIRRDNIKKARFIKDYEEEARTAIDVAQLTTEDQAVLDKFLNDIIHIKSQQIHKSTKNISQSKALNEDLVDIGSFSEWNSPTEDLIAKYVNLSSAIALKQVELMKSDAENSYNQVLVKTMQSAINTIQDRIKKEEHRNDSLAGEHAGLQHKLAESKRRNEEAAAKVALYEDPELEDAMQERIQMALDAKEKELQAHLQEQLDKKAQEIGDEDRANEPNQLITPRKMDLVGDSVRLENECYQLEEHKTSLELQSKGVRAQRDSLADKLRIVQEKKALLQKNIGELTDQHANMVEELESLKNDSITDKKTRALQKQLADIDANNAVRSAKFNKAKQVLVAALNDAEVKFKTGITLDSVLQEYEEILEDYEEQYTGKPTNYFVNPTATAPSHSSVFVAPAPVDMQKKPKAQLPKTTTRPQTRSATKSQGFPNTADKESPTHSRTSTSVVGKLVFNDNENEEEAEGEVGEDAQSTNSNKPVSDQKKKRKEPPAATADDNVDDSPVKQSDCPLEIVGFSPAMQQVVLKNISKEPVKLSAFKVRNCDYCIVQLLPDYDLPPGQTFTINPRPSTVGSLKPPKNQMFWNTGNNGIFEKDSKGIWLLNKGGVVATFK